MDFEDTAEEAAYRTTVREWLAANAAEYKTPYEGDVDLVVRGKAWQAKKYAAGYVGITWPKALGGQGGTPMQQIIFNQEESKYWVPAGIYAIGLGMCIPTVFTHGRPEIIQRYVPVAMKGEEIWCQLLS